MKEHATIGDFKSGDYHDKLFLFHLAQRKSQAVFTKYDGTPVHYPKRRFVNLIDTIYDKNKGMRRNIKYVEGCTSIFVDEQDKETDGKARMYRTEFKHGKYLVLGNNPKLIEFMMITNFNGSNPDRDTGVIPLFNFVDQKKKFKEIMKKEEFEQDAVHWCNKAPFQEVLRYARVLLAKQVDSMDSDEIRYNMKQFAKARPERFMSDKKVPRIIRKSHILEAIDKEILFINEATRSISWQNSQNIPIVTAPVGVDAVDHFVQTSFTLEGEKIYNAIKDFLFPKMVDPSSIINSDIPTGKLEPEEVIEPLLAADEDFADLEKLFDIGIEAGVIQSKKNWHHYQHWKAMGKPNFVKELRLDRTLLNTLRKELRTIGS
jgi:hypothetical protein